VLGHVKFTLYYFLSQRRSLFPEKTTFRWPLFPVFQLCFLLAFNRLIIYKNSGFLIWVPFGAVLGIIRGTIDESAC
jgi:hypothetical protein